jgi:Protein of unknown function (DUF3139).
MKNTKSREILKAILIVVLIIALAFGLLIYLLFNGNPVERYKTRGKTINYLSQKYPNTKFEVKKTFFNFKDGNYGAKVKAENKMQTEFYVNLYKKQNAKDDYIEKKFSQELNLKIEPKVRKIIANASTSIQIFLKEGSKYNENSEYSKDMKDLDILLTVKWEDEKINKESFAKECVEVVSLLNAEGFNLNDYFFSCNDVKNGDFVVDIGKKGLSNVKVSPEELLKRSDIRYFNKASEKK